jgi:hypothetical protein
MWCEHPVFISKRFQMRLGWKKCTIRFHLPHKVLLRCRISGIASITAARKF